MRYDEATQTETTAYLARDGLGSVSVVFDSNGTELERFFHEPFGRRVNVEGKPLQSFTPVTEVSLGFTGHRQDDDFDLIDMNGRVYDPVQRRFLTPDPLVSNPFDGQAYNRYAYVRNNPLRYTDPSGFQSVTSSRRPPRSLPRTASAVSNCHLSSSRQLLRSSHRPRRSRRPTTGGRPPRSGRTPRPLRRSLHPPQR